MAEKSKKIKDAAFWGGVNVDQVDLADLEAADAMQDAALGTKPNNELLRAESAPKKKAAIKSRTGAAADPSPEEDRTVDQPTATRKTNGHALNGKSIATPVAGKAPQSGGNGGSTARPPRNETETASADAHPTTPTVDHNTVDHNTVDHNTVDHNDVPDPEPTPNPRQTAEEPPKMATKTQSSGPTAEETAEELAQMRAKKAELEAVNRMLRDQNEALARSDQGSGGGSGGGSGTGNGNNQETPPPHRIEQLKQGSGRGAIKFAIGFATAVGAVALFHWTGWNPLESGNAQDIVDLGHAALDGTPETIKQGYQFVTDGTGTSAFESDVSMTVKGLTGDQAAEMGRLSQQTQVTRDVIAAMVAKGEPISEDTLKDALRAHSIALNNSEVLQSTTGGYSTGAPVAQDAAFQMNHSTESGSEGTTTQGDGTAKVTTGDSNPGTGRETPTGNGKPAWGY